MGMCTCNAKFLLSKMLLFFLFIGDKTIFDNVKAFNLTKKCTLLCNSANGHLEKICNEIHSGDITLAWLSLLEKYRHQIEDLMKIGMPDSKYDQLQKKLEQRLDEQTHFDNRLNLLKQLCQNIDIEIEGNITSEGGMCNNYYLLQGWISCVLKLNLVINQALSILFVFVLIRLLHSYPFNLLYLLMTSLLFMKS